MKSSTLQTKGFKFKQFAISGGQSGMPVSTDGVLLGAWAFRHSPRQILDIGTGTGLLALMCAQRFEQALIQAVDIDEHAYRAAGINIANSPWSQRIELRHENILHCCDTQRVDAIICNPPYFNYGAVSQHSQRATARHTSSLSHKDLIRALTRLLTPDGTAALILPLVEGEQFIRLAQDSGWHLSRCCEVRPSERKPVHRLLFELQQTQCDCQFSTLTIHESDAYSADFIALTRTFYLKM